MTKKQIIARLETMIYDVGRYSVYYDEIRELIAQVKKDDAKKEKPLEKKIKEKETQEASY